MIRQNFAISCVWEESTCHLLYDEVAEYRYDVIRYPRTRYGPELLVLNISICITHGILITYVTLNTVYGW